MSTTDYGASGKTICEAFVIDAKRFPRKSPEENFVLWNGAEVRTSVLLTVPKAQGILRFSFLRQHATPRQGIDIKVEGGALISEKNQRFPLLRTWADADFEDVLEYAFDAPEKSIWVWNCYEMEYANGQRTEEKWTGNAGMVVEKISDECTLLHCSHGGTSPPKFDALVVKIEII